MGAAPKIELHYDCLKEADLDGNVKTVCNLLVLKQKKTFLLLQTYT